MSDSGIVKAPLMHCYYSVKSSDLGTGQLQDLPEKNKTKQKAMPSWNSESAHGYGQVASEEVQRQFGGE